MTRINTNVSSLQAQINLSRNNNDLQTALTRLSTGLRINSGKDDPAGLIASETLRSDIKATEVGISNSESANQMIATADSALGQISDLLVDIRGLVNEAANSGSMSAAQIAANQLQVDSSLDAIDRISQITQFQGSRLLDGSLDFTTAGVDNSSIDSVQINQASFGTNSSIGVNVELISQATKGTLTYEGGATTNNLVLQVGGDDGFQAFSFDAGTSISDMAAAINLVSDATGVTAEAEGVLEWQASAASTTVASYGDNNDIVITAKAEGEAAGAYYVRYLTSNSGTAGQDTTVAITESDVDSATGEITYGYIDVTLGTTDSVATEFTDLSADVDVQSLADGTIDLTNLGLAESLDWDAKAGNEGVFVAPTVTITAVSAGGSDTATYDDATHTYSVSLAGATLSSSALATLLTDATDSQFTFSNGTANTVDTAATANGAIDTAGVNGAEAAFELNATAVTAGAAGDDAFSIVFANGAGASAATYNATTNVYTVTIDNNAGVYSITSADLADALNNAGGDAVEHTFDTGSSAGTEVVNAGVQGGDWTFIANADSTAAITTNGDDGGTINATANEVVDAINDKQEELSIDLFTVENASGSDGSGAVTVSQVTAITGTDSGQDPDANNMLQYQALEGMYDIEYVASGKNTELSLAITDAVYTQASAIIDLGIANGTFELKTKATGEDANQDIKIAWATAADEAVAWDEASSTLTITIDDDDTTTTVDSIIGMINDTAATNTVFSASLAQVEGSSETVGTGAGVVTSAMVDPATISVPESASLTGGVATQGKVTINLATDSSGNVTTTANDLIDFLENSDEQLLKDYQLQVTNTGSSLGTGLLEATTDAVSFATAGTTYTDANASGSTHAANGSSAQITVTASEAGSAYDDVLVRIVEDSTLAADSASVSWSEDSNTLLVSYNGSRTADQIAQLINTDSDLAGVFTAEATEGVGNGSGLVSDGDFVYLSGGVTSTSPSGAGTTVTDVAAMVSLNGGQDIGSDSSDAILTFSAANYGSDSYVSVKAIQGSFDVTDASGATVYQTYGTDVQARINGLMAVGDGLNASLSTSSLQMQLGIDVNMTAGETSSFSITGGGAQFQIGPDVVSNQQAVLGIMSVSSTTLGGVNGHGYLYQLREGENFDLTTDTTGAAAIVEDTITQVTSLRGRLGAFQKTTLETNIASLQDTLETLTAAESSIRDADFAEESSALTRAQILVQSGTKVLGIANQQPQNVLSLIG